MNKEIVRSCGLGDMVDAVEAGLCPFCRKSVVITDFRDELSKKEFQISGLCQKCQDKFFGM